MSRLIHSLALSLIALVASGSAVAHEGGEAFIHVPLDHVMPGEPFQVIAADFAPGAAVELHMLRGEDSVLLLTTSAAPDGHFEANLVLPSNYSHGYAELVGLDEFGTRAATFVLVGPRGQGLQAPASQPAQAPIWSDPSVLLLGALITVGLGALGFLVLRPSARRPGSGTSAAKQRARRRAGSGTQARRS